MTAISFPTSVPAPARATRLRLTVRGRRVLALLAALPALIALAIAMAMGSGAALASLDVGAPAGAFESVVVSAGDTLWSIAEDVAPGHDPRDVVDQIARLNALNGVSVQVGQELAIPAEYSEDR
ncbi:LysM peptidoglycan-binding domain-containing protein [Microbacterium kyungheense]|uniref:LysM domain-containing protein n=1 Tax=Microbacterium kyungheense TaxID=1263636 RepID=A0A543FLR9_9MICO|nr:LysM peptidoglycan-binding domain-containing protein [Microbacterium kyungheense]TQM34791.1 LysM domain-containing protein [Microbacterium kyungheense]